ncbi:transcriptional regulator NrdR [Mycoavidus sp. B2-EB]|uniref:transcriptional regulator NrdR n=1 Tax=Mycoavidus sp. B2-EB TaxID=2651972 RepID=UPI001628193E|nr:transcriptional regulator NrdR [Mycoavidus sp. B2-EB]BBO60099.1 transcriptional repressor NrdR [Mycoavidus sp. B2-EB]
MRCPFCRHEDTQVADSRLAEDGAAIRRRRRCPGCDKRFTTYERVELALPAVVKKEGSRVEFDRHKIAASMQLALRKRPVSAEAVDDAIARIEYQLLSAGEREIHSDKLGELVMHELRQLDKIAYVRFASVYRSFEDVSEFQQVIKEIKQLQTAEPLPRKR